jgi:histidinol dehydrogenase
VKTRGDDALIDFTQKFDGVRLNSLQVSETIISDAFLKTNPKVIKALQQAIDNIKYYHQQQTMFPFEYERNGRLIGQQVIPIQRVGVYIPAGTAVYPSTVLMNVIPAQIAGVPSISLTSPVQQNGEIHSTILAAYRERAISTSRQGRGYGTQCRV